MKAGMGLDEAGENEPKPRKTNGERRVRHRSRVERLKALLKVKEGRLLDHDRAWME
jgi:hypothetical protein